MTNVREVHVDDMAQAYALDALEPDEREFVDTHVVECGACADTLERAQRVTSLLALAAEQRELPVGHAAHFRARVAAEPRATPIAPPAKRRPDDVVGRIAAAWRAALGAPTRRLAPLSAAALLVLGFGAWNVRLQQELAHQQQFVRVLTQSDTRELTPSVASGDAQGKAFLDRSTDRILLSLSRLPELPADRTYQVWFTRPDNRLESGGTFEVGEGGTGLMLATAPAGLEAYVGVGLTSEPHGGSRAPTTPMIMYWALSGTRETGI